MCVFCAAPNLPIGHCITGQDAERSELETCMACQEEAHAQVCDSCQQSKARGPSIGPLEGSEDKLLAEELHWVD